MANDDPTETLVNSPRKRASAKRVTAGGLLGRYVILQELGRGGMSVVYVAYDPQLDRRVALKVVRGDRLSEAHRARLHREAQALARLSHPAVVTVFDVGDLAEDTFVAMELVDGQSLREWLKTPRPWREAVRVIAAAGRGLAAAHAAGIVHRDVKPDNIVIATTGSVKLVDFGLARDLGDRSIDSTETPDPEASAAASSESLDPASSNASLSASTSASASSRRLEQITQFGHVVGTPAYMPPEQRGRSVDADERSDQFSLCATLYEALYRQKPFAVSRKDFFDRAEQLTVVDKPGPDTRSLAAAPPKDTDVPAWLQRVVARGLAVDPAGRYPSVEALLAALDRDPARTRRRVAATAGALLGVAGVATLVTWTVKPDAEVAPARPTCDDGATRVAATWNATRRDAIARAAHAHAEPWIGGALAAFADRVDGYTAAWRRSFQDACRATKVAGTQSAEAMDLRMACLDRRLGELGALVTVMDGAGVDVLRRAGEVVASLPPVADCDDVAALRLVVKPPTEPAAVARLAAIDGDLSRVTALFAIGDATKTVALADHVIAEARAVGYAPPLARALYWRGRAIADRDGGAEAIKMFDETFATALSAGEDTMAADAAARLAQETLWAGKLPEFARWQRIALGLAQRVGATSVRTFVDQLGCMAMHFTGKPLSRLACLRALAKRVEAHGTPSEWLVTTLGVAASDAGELEEAITWLTRGVDLAAAENGADHPRTLEMRAYRCRGYLDLGDYPKAAEDCGDALARLQKFAPDDRALVARLQWYLGDAEAALDHAAAARPLLEAAARSDDDELKLGARARLAELGDAHAARTRAKVEAAIAEHRDALATMIKTFGDFDPHHPNILGERLELGAALLEHGDAAAALTELARADREADEAELNPLVLAQIRYHHAQAMVRVDAKARPEATRLARSALALVQQHAPATPKFAKDRAAIEAWLAANP